MVHFSELVPTTSGHRNEFQLARNVSVPRDRKMPWDVGTTMCRKTPQWDRPSMMPASSISRGKPRKYCRNRNTLKTLNRPGTMRPWNVLTQPRSATMTYSGRNDVALGIMSVMTTRNRTSRDQRLGIRASA